MFISKILKELQINRLMFDITQKIERQDVRTVVHSIQKPIFDQITNFSPEKSAADDFESKNYTSRKSTDTLTKRNKDLIIYPS